MMQVREKTELFVAYVARGDIFADPVGSLSDLQILNPAQIGTRADIYLRHWHPDESYLHLLADFTLRCSSTKGNLAVSRTGQPERPGVVRFAFATVLVYSNGHAYDQGLFAVLARNTFDLDYELKPLFILVK